MNQSLAFAFESLTLVTKNINLQTLDRGIELIKQILGFHINVLYLCQGRFGLCEFCIKCGKVYQIYSQNTKTLMGKSIKHIWNSTPTNYNTCKSFVISSIAFQIKNQLNVQHMLHILVFFLYLVCFNPSRRECICIIGKIMFPLDVAQFIKICTFLIEVYATFSRAWP